jgi:hypothetical protein
VDAIADTFKAISMFHAQHAYAGINRGGGYDGIEVGHTVHLFCLALTVDLGFQHEYNTGQQGPFCQGQSQYGRERVEPELAHYCVGLRTFVSSESRNHASC